MNNYIVIIIIIIIINIIIIIIIIVFHMITFHCRRCVRASLCFALLFSEQLTKNSHDWPRQNFSLQYPYNIKQKSDENKEKYKLGDY